MEFLAVTPFLLLLLSSHSQYSITHFNRDVFLVEKKKKLFPPLRGRSSICLGRTRGDRNDSGLIHLRKGGRRGRVTADVPAWRFWPAHLGNNPVVYFSKEISSLVLADKLKNPKSDALGMRVFFCMGINGILFLSLHSDTSEISCLSDRDQYLTAYLPVFFLPTFVPEFSVARGVTRWALNTSLLLKM